MGEFEYRVLGPVEVLGRRGKVSIKASRQRAVLASLLLEANRVVSIDRLIRQLWGDAPPARARNTVQSLVLRLRKAFAAAHPCQPNDVLVTKQPGYLLQVGAGQLDLASFDQLAAEGRAALLDGKPERAADSLGRALALWRGDPLSDAAGVGLQEVDVPRLRERRLQAIEDRIEVDLMMERYPEVIIEVPALIAEHPLRERLYGQLMLALYRANRQAEALEVFQTLRRQLIDELAVEPTSAVQRLHLQMLSHDPSLEVVSR
ncbi:hypothetical protein Rhe02_10520 [Rhizocola hellebori]|uniref:OmpR/PhoB-type domain-containing protein n=1 Tax=Rhizocola hellebori TaxID=1392758 RepID=A0A8J3Q356_9ACTN|nr:AfsR/SARP family transcriptional regulator [Rhizocola hellebori]GIH02985.1 hypothetical protein Rhe02_10520 [Rhizocola hellebori]